jgi:ABC-type lipoprotein export system ATPase subunit
MIRVENVRYRYNAEKTIAFPNLTIEKGQHYLLLGSSGSGKTTLLHLLGGLLRSQEGKIEVQGTDITTLSEHEMDHYRGQHFGFIFQRNHLISALSVRNNLLMAPFLSGLPQIEQRVDEVLEQLQIHEQKHSRINQLSQGQAQRVAIARAVLNQPTVLLADEPTSALDDQNCERVIDLLLQTASFNQTTLLVATHDQRLKSKITNVITL